MSDTPETDRLAEEFKRNTLSDDVKLDVLFGYTRKLERECTRLERERDKAREELHKASVEANALATSIQKAEYSDAKEFELLGSVAGVISQIDNMYAGVRQQRDEARDLAHRFRSLYYAKLGIVSSTSWFPWEGGK